MVARMEVRNAFVKDLIETNLSSLKDSMNQEGVKLDDFDVFSAKGQTKNFDSFNEFVDTNNSHAESLDDKVQSNKENNRKTVSIDSRSSRHNRKSIDITV